MLLCVGLESVLSPKILLEISNHCNDWSKGDQIRIKVLSGRNIFISTNEKSKLFFTYNIYIGERVRTPIGLAKLIGTANNKLWFTFEETGLTWFFTKKQIKEGKEKGFFIRCSYEKNNDLHYSENSEIIKNKKSNENINNIEKLYKISKTISTYDFVFINEIMDPIRWPEEIDTLLVSFLVKLAENSKISIWNVTCENISNEYRGLQILLSRLVMSDSDLSHRWGISGPKRKAVIARLGNIFVCLFDCLIDWLFYLFVHVYFICLYILYLYFVSLLCLFIYLFIKLFIY